MCLIALLPCCLFASAEPVKVQLQVAGMTGEEGDDVPLLPCCLFAFVLFAAPDKVQLR